MITVDNDTPVATAATSTGTVDEDGVVEGIADAGPGDGIAGGTGDEIAGQVAPCDTGNVSFHAGADEPLSYGFTANRGCDVAGAEVTVVGGVARSAVRLRTR